MHEFSLCQGLVSLLYRQPQIHDGKPLKSIELTIGPLAGVEVELVKHAFPQVVANTPFAEIALRVKPSDIVVRCQHCGLESHRTINQLTCASCASADTIVVQGDECALTKLSYGDADHVQ